MSILFDETKERTKCDHGNLQKREKTTGIVAWCGSWYDCPACGFSRLVVSSELKSQLREQERATD